MFPFFQFIIHFFLNWNPKLQSFRAITSRHSQIIDRQITGFTSQSIGHHLDFYKRNRHNTSKTYKAVPCLRQHMFKIFNTGKIWIKQNHAHLPSPLQKWCPLSPVNLQVMLLLRQHQKSPSIPDKYMAQSHFYNETRLS